MTPLGPFMVDSDADAGIYIPLLKMLNGLWSPKGRKSKRYGVIKVNVLAIQV